LAEKHVKKEWVNMENNIKKFLNEVFSDINVISIRNMDNIIIIKFRFSDVGTVIEMFNILGIFAVEFTVSTVRCTNGAIDYVQIQLKNINNTVNGLSFKTFFSAPTR